MRRNLHITISKLRIQICHQCVPLKRRLSSHGNTTAAGREDQSYNAVLMKILHMIRSFRNRGIFLCLIRNP